MVFLSFLEVSLLRLVFVFWKREKGGGGWFSRGVEQVEGSKDAKE